MIIRALRCTHYTKGRFSERTQHPNSTSLARRRANFPHPLTQQTALPLPSSCPTACVYRMLTLPVLIITPIKVTKKVFYRPPKPFLDNK